MSRHTEVPPDSRSLLWVLRPCRGSPCWCPRTGCSQVRMELWGQGLYLHRAPCAWHRGAVMGHPHGSPLVSSPDAAPQQHPGLSVLSPSPQQHRGAPCAQLLPSSQGSPGPQWPCGSTQPRSWGVGRAIPRPTLSNKISWPRGTRSIPRGKPTSYPVLQQLPESSAPRAAARQGQHRPCSPCCWRGLRVRSPWPPRLPLTPGPCPSPRGCAGLTRKASAAGSSPLLLVTGVGSEDGAGAFSLSSAAAVFVVSDIAVVSSGLGAETPAAG